MRADLAQARARVAGALGAASKPVRARSWRRGARGGAAVRAARRPALRDRRHPLRHRAQQGAQGHRRPLAAADGPARACSGPAGTATACRSSSRSRRSWARPSASSAPAEFRERCERARAEVRRRHARRVQAARLLGDWDDPYLTLSKDYEARSRAQLAGFARARAHLPRQEAGALVPRAPHRAGRGRGRVRGPHLAVDLRAVPAGGRSRQGRPAAQGEAGGVRHLDDDALDAAGEPRDRRQPGARATSRCRSRATARRVPGRRRRAAPRASWRRAGIDAPDGDAGSAISRAGLRSARRHALRAARSRGSTPTQRRRLPAVVRAPRDARGRHRPGAHRARARRRRLHRRARASACRSTRRSTTTGASPPTSSTVGRPCARVRRQPEDRRSSSPTRGLLLNKPGRDGPPPVPALLALQEPDHLPRHPAVVRALGDGRATRRRCATAALAEIAQDAVDPGLGREPHPRHDRGAPRLVPVAPARLGRADPGVSLQRLREGSARRRRLWSTWPRSSRAKARTPGSRGRRRSCCRAGTALQRVRQAARCEKQHDIVDVWFESGVSWAAVADGKLVPTRARRSTSTSRAPTSTAAGSTRRCSPSSATRGQAPYKAVLTHGWVLDEHGKPYSKSEIAQGARRAARRSTTSSPTVVDGEERRRAAAPVDGGRPTTRATSSSREAILNQLGESYRKIRNTCRYLLSNLYDFVPARDRLDDDRAARAGSAGAGPAARARPPDLRGLPALRLPRGGAAAQRLRRSPCRPSTSTRSRTRSTARRRTRRARRSVQTALYEMTRTLATWMAPILCFTAQDVADELGARDRRAVRRARAACASERLSRRARRRPTPTSAGSRRSARAARRSCGRWRRSAPTGTSRWRRACTVTPTAAERPHWQWNLDHLTELCVVSRVELDPADAPPARDRDRRRRGARARPARAAGGAPAMPPRPAPPIRTSAGAAPALRRRRRGAPHEPADAPQVPRSFTRVHRRSAWSLDQWTKVLARDVLRPRGPFNPKVIIHGFFDLRYAENPGVAFSMLQDLPGGRLLLTLLAVAAFVLVIAYLRKTPAESDAPARRAGAGGRRRDREPHRPRHVRQGHRLHRLEVRGSTSGRPSTSPTPRSAWAWGSCCST